MMNFGSLNENMLDSILDSLKIKMDYDNYFVKKDNKLDIKSNIDILGMYPVEIELRTFNEENEGILIATVLGYYFDMEYIYNEGILPLDVFDAYNQETYDAYEVLFRDNDYKEELEVFNPNLFLLSEIMIEKDYRRQGYGTILITQLYEILKYVAKLNVGIISVVPYISENEELLNKMNNMFLSNGYKCVDDNKEYLYKLFM